MEPRRRRSKLVYLAIIATFAVIAIVGVVEFANQPSGLNSGTQASQSSLVRTAFSNHLGEIEVMNISAIRGEYTANATTEFYSPGVGDYFLGGSAGKAISDMGHGPQQIGNLFSGVFLSDFVIPHITNANYTVSVSGTVAMVHSTFDVEGTNLDGSDVYASVDLHATYLKTGGNWMISQELWNFTDVTSHG